MHLMNLILMVMCGEGVSRGDVENMDWSTC